VSVHPLAGKPAPASALVDLARLERAYFEARVDPSDARQRVAFGTSGHRGSSLDGTFTESHIFAITQAICDYRRAQGIEGPLMMGRDTHALSPLAQRSALEVLAANGVETRIQRDDGVTPTPAISRAILTANRGRRTGLADGIVVTPSHNPPEDGGFKYNPPHGGPAESSVTRWIEERANALLGTQEGAVKRVSAETALRAETTRRVDFMLPYVEGLASVVDLESIRAAGLRLGVDPLGGASLPYWEPIQTRYGLDLTIVNPKLDPTFSFMTLDSDGKIRMDPSSPYAAASLVGLRDRFQLAFGNDPDADRHGIVTPDAGLLNPNAYLAVAIDYLLGARPRWPADSAVGKTVVTSSLIDRVVTRAGRRLQEVPVGFKWFASGLLEGTLCFAGEESAGASFLCFDGSPWSTDKDGLIADLLAGEILARTGKDPGQRYRELASELGEPHYVRIDRPATPEQKQRLAQLSPEGVRAETLAGEPILARLARAPGNGEPIGGLKVVTATGWFAARPSGTEDIYKIYAESFAGPERLDAIVAEAQRIVADALA
jgi:phosphoglucomutase